jgi:hypothetical protein
LKLLLLFLGALLLKKYHLLLNAYQGRKRRLIKHAATNKLAIRGEQEKDLTCKIPLSGPHLLLPLLRQAHEGGALLVDRLKLAAELFHGAG